MSECMCQNVCRIGEGREKQMMSNNLARSQLWSGKEAFTKSATVLCLGSHIKLPFYKMV
jgi:hypothetical protein